MTVKKPHVQQQATTSAHGSAAQYHGSRQRFLQRDGPVFSVTWEGCTVSALRVGWSVDDGDRRTCAVSSCHSLLARTERATLRYSLWYMLFAADVAW